MDKQIKIFEQQIVFNAVDLTGSAAQIMRVVSGSRFLLTLQVTAIDPGTTVEVLAEDSISVDDVFQPIAPGGGLTGVGVMKRVYSDFNPLLRIRYTVTGGNATFKIAIAMYDNASTTRIENAQLSVNLSDVTDSEGHFDAVRVGDGSGDYLNILEDGSIPVSPGLAPGEVPVNPYGEQLALASGAEATLVTYTVPNGFRAFLYRVEASGENIARFRVYINDVPVATRRTGFGGDLTTKFEFTSPNKEQMVLQAGDILEVTALHMRPDAGDFEGRIQLLLKPV
jgi:hypothetical protein